LTWAEPFGIGEMALAPDVFWSLTVREFLLKHAAFDRAENRQRALVIDLAVRTGHYKDSDHQQMVRDMHALRRYPEKSWLK
jgi:hypothetical protein